MPDVPPGPATPLQRKQRDPEGREGALGRRMSDRYGNGTEREKNATCRTKIGKNNANNEVICSRPDSIAPVWLPPISHPISKSINVFGEAQNILMVQMCAPSPKRSDFNPI